MRAFRGIQFCLYVLLPLLLLTACNFQNHTIQQMTFEEDNVKVVYSGKEYVSLDYVINYKGIELHSERVGFSKGEVKFLPLLKKQEAFSKIDTIAYTIACTGDFNVHYMLKNGEEIWADSIKTYNIPDVLNSYNSKINFARILTEGYGAIKRCDYLQYYKQAKVFLVRNNLKTTDEFVRRMAYFIYVILNNGHENLYELSEIKTVKSLPQRSVPINTTMNFDFFYLLAVNNEANLRAFVESEIVDDFERGKRNNVAGDKQILLTPILYNSYASGRMYLFLLGINKNWDYDYCPVGGIAIDNIAPTLLWENPLPSIHLNLFGNYSADDCIEKFDDYYIRFPDILYQSQIKDVTWGNFEGNNYWGYPITFTVNIAKVGDLASVILQGKRYDIDMLQAFKRNCFVFEHRIPQLNIGDNYITIKFVDRIGNVSSGKINIATERVPNNEN